MLAGGVAWMLAAAAPGTMLSWHGRACVRAGGRDLDLTVEPFRRARSRSWITADGEARARTLVIEPHDGWLERGGRREPLPAALIAHERQQYGLYGYLLRALRGEGARGARLREPGFPDARFRFEDGWPVSADYAVAAPEPGRLPVAQRFSFSDPRPGDELRWPRRIAIAQDGRPFFDLRIDSFKAFA
jgi:hypothetical protein